MAVTVSNVLAGSNAYATPPQDVATAIDEVLTAGVLSGMTVVAQSSPNATVKVNSGVALVTATPTSESARLFRVKLSASSNVTISSNSSGSTKYDKVYLYLPAATLHTPPASGDFTEAVTLLTERHNSAGEALTATNALELAEVTVANGFTTIINGNISATGAQGGVNTIRAQRQEETTNTVAHPMRICTGTKSVQRNSANNIVSGTITFPFTFSEVPFVVINYHGISANPNNLGSTTADGARTTESYGVTTTAVNFRVYTADGTTWPDSTNYVYITWTAIGK